MLDSRWKLLKVVALIRRKKHCLRLLNSKLDTYSWHRFGKDYSMINKIGWVEDATVERRLPGIIRISLRERIPIVLLQTTANTI